MYAPITSACTVLFTLVLGFFAVEKVCMFHEEYLKQSQIIEKDSWLRLQCSNPVTYAKINHHPGLCEKIEAVARRGAFWHAVYMVSSSLPFDEVLIAAQRASWQFFAVLAVLCLIFPSLVISQIRSKQDKIPMYSPCYPEFKGCP
jgi:hypothetical protein